MKKKTAPTKKKQAKKPLLDTIAMEVGSVAGAIVNTTRSLRASAASMVEGKKKPAKAAKRPAKAKTKRKATKQKRKKAGA